MRARYQANHQAAAEAARADRGTWTLAGIYPSRSGGQDAARRIPLAVRTPSYAPAGEFEAYAAPHESGGMSVWVRCVLGMTDLVPRPTSMTYRVCDRGAGRAYVGVRIVVATVAAECPRCGGPRGEARRHRFCEDGEWYVVHQWDNPCGHVDLYEAVLLEHRKRLRAIERAADRAAARAVIAGPDDALLHDRRTVADVAWMREVASSNPYAFRQGLARTLAALDGGEDLATAPWNALDPAQAAAEIEALAGIRRLSLLAVRKDSK